MSGRIEIPEWLREGVAELQRNYRVTSIPNATLEDWYLRLGDMGSGTERDFRKAVRRCIDDLGQVRFPTWAEFARHVPRHSRSGEDKRTYEGTWDATGQCSKIIDGEYCFDPAVVFAGVDYERLEKIVAYVFLNCEGPADWRDKADAPFDLTYQQRAFVEALIPGSYEGWKAMREREGLPVGTDARVGGRA